MSLVLHGWPWLGLAMALVLLGVLSAPRTGRTGGTIGQRVRDPRVLVWLGLPLYMLHQFEEHGVDFLGRTFAFQGSLCATIGHTGPLDACPASAAFIFAVNVGSVWIAMSGAGLAGPRRATVAAAALGIPAVNAIAHLLPALRTGTYNPGVVSALVVFVPACALTLRELVRQGLLRRAELVVVPASGVVVHAVLLGSLAARAKGAFGEVTLVLIQVANGFVPLAIGLGASRLRAATAPRLSESRQD